MASIITWGTMQKVKLGPLFFKKVTHYQPAAAATTLVSAAANVTITAANALATGLSFTVTTQPAVPRNVVLTVVDTTPSVTSGYVDVFGIDCNGKPVTETFAITGAGTYTGYVPFLYIITVYAYLWVGAAYGGDETLAIGLGTKHGLPMGPQEELVQVVKALHNHAGEAVGTVDFTYGTVIPTSASNADHDQEFWYLTRLRQATY